MDLSTRLLRAKAGSFKGRISRQLRSRESDKPAGPHAANNIGPKPTVKALVALVGRNDTRTAFVGKAAEIDLKAHGFLRGSPISMSVNFDPLMQHRGQGRTSARYPHFSAPLCSLARSLWSWKLRAERGVCVRLLMSGHEQVEAGKCIR